MSLRKSIESYILDEGVTAAYAVSEAFHGLAERFRTMGSPVFRDKARDVLDLERRILDHILGRTRERLEKVEEPVVLLAHERPSRTQFAASPAHSGTCPPCAL